MTIEERSQIRSDLSRNNRASLLAPLEELIGGTETDGHINAYHCRYCACEKDQLHARRRGASVSPSGL